MIIGVGKLSSQTGAEIRPASGSVSSSGQEAPSSGSADSLSTSPETKESQDTQGLDSLIGGLDGNYGGPPGQQGKGGVKNEEAQRQMADNQQSGKKALSGAQANQSKMAGLKQQLETIRSGPQAGPTNEKAAQVSSEVKERPAQADKSPQVSNLEIKREPFHSQNSDKLPVPSKGQTRSRLQVETGSAGRETLQAEATQQRAQQTENKDSLDKSGRFQQELEKDRAHNLDFQQKSNQAEQQTAQELQKQEQQVAQDQQVSSQAEQKLQQAKQRVGQDQQQVEKDQRIVDTDQQHLNTANTSLQEAQTESSEAQQMVQEASQSVQKAQQLKPGNGGPNQGQGKGGGQGGKGQGGKGQANGNGHGVVWKRTLASAKDFQQKASARRRTSQVRRQSAQTNVQTAQQKLDKDKQGLQKSQSHLQQSRRNEQIRTGDQQIAQRNLSSSQKKRRASQTTLAKLYEQKQFLEQQKELLGDTGQTLNDNRSKLGENGTRIADNIARLEIELRSNPQTSRTVQLQELHGSSQGSDGTLVNRNKNVQNALNNLIPLQA